MAWRSLAQGLSTRLYLIVTLCALFGTSAQARDYLCAAFPKSDGSFAENAQITVLKSMVVLNDVAGQVTARMSYRTLVRGTYNDETSIIILYGNSEKTSSGALRFGPELRLQRYFYDTRAPRLEDTTCKATK